MSEYSYVGDCSLCEKHVESNENFRYDTEDKLICEDCSDKIDFSLNLDTLFIDHSDKSYMDIISNGRLSRKTILKV
jgi:hypothetical protein